MTKPESKDQQENEHEPIKFQSLLPSLAENVTYITNAFYETEDLQCRDIFFRKQTGKLIYLETMADPKVIGETLLIPLATATRNYPLEKVIANTQMKRSSNLIEVIKQLLSGYSVIIFDGYSECYLINTPQEHSRSPDEPENEKVVRGSHQGFVENLELNLNLIRQGIKNRQLKINYFESGYESNTNIAVIYMDQIANANIVEQIKKKISSIKLDMILSPGYLEELIEEKPLSPFPQNLYTERPDRVKAHLMEGRVAIMTDGSSDAIILPVTFFSFFQSPDDYNNRYFEGSFFRILRIISFWGTLILPALYIAVVGFHFEIIPFDLVTLVKNSTERVPFPPLSEALLMAITIELIREAGIRLPTPIGQTIGIVGGLIIGDAVVNAGLVSHVMVIVIALTAIMSFAISSYEIGNVARILSFPIMVGAATLGFVGIVFSFMFILIHMCKLQTLGVPYIAPLSPFNLSGLKDTFLRFPIWLMDKRPEYLRPKQLKK